jgi:hypothetical protein
VGERRHFGRAATVSQTRISKMRRYDTLEVAVGITILSFSDPDGIHLELSAAL